MAQPSSMRPLVAGSGTVSALGASAHLVQFSQSQNFKTGTMIFSAAGGNWPVFVIKSGSDKIWTTIGPGQPATASAFRCSDTSSSRARGGSFAYIPPEVPVFSYLSMRDSSGNPDFYMYQDTLFPENGVHPYTHDQWTGQVWWTAAIAAGAGGLSSYLIDSRTRLRVHEGRLTLLDSNPPLSDSLIGQPWSG